MKKFTKVSLIITAVLLAVGIGLIAVAGVMSGGLGKLHEQAMAGEFDFGNWHIGNGVWYSEEEWDDDWDNFVGIGFGNTTLTGGNESTTDTFLMSDIEKITVDTDQADISFVTSADVDHAIVTMERGFLKHYSVEIKDGTLLIKYDTHNQSYEFGPNITIKLPESIDMNTIDVDTALGDINMKNIEISCKNFELDTDLGDITLTNVKMNCNMSLYTDLGDVVIEDGEYQAVDAKTALGDVKLSGSFNGDIEAESDLGDVKVELDAKEEYYNYELSTDLGSVRLNGKSYSDGGDLGAHQTFENSGAIYDVELNTSLGDVSVVTK